MKLKFAFMSLILSLQSSGQQTFPKLMQAFANHTVTMRYVEGEFQYFDWEGKRIPEMTIPYDVNKTKYLYVDSNGISINNQTYDFAHDFVDGAAIIETPGQFNHDSPRQYAVINTKGEVIFPFRSKELLNMGCGIIVENSEKNQDVYGLSGKKIAECGGCQVSVDKEMKHILMWPRDRSPDELVVRILKLDGQEILRHKGESISRVDNNISTNEITASVRQPYYTVCYSNCHDWHGAQQGVFSREGKMVMDSVRPFVFNFGYAPIVKNGVATLVDTNFKTILPASYGYQFYWPLRFFPGEAYCAKKGDKWIVIDRQNKQLFPFEAPRELWYDPKHQRLECRSDEQFWLLSPKGDTLLDARKYIAHYDPQPFLPGYIVRCKDGGQIGYVSEKGKLILPCEYSNLGAGGKGLLLFFKPNLAGFMDENGKIKFSFENCINLSAFDHGYAVCGLKVNDPAKMSPSAQTVMDGQETYQIQNKLVDSTGHFVSDENFDWIFPFRGGYAAVIKNGESYLVDKNLKKLNVEGNSYVTSYFCKGYALAYNPQKNSVGLVNEKLEVVVPLIYEQLDMLTQETGVYGYNLFSETRAESGPGFTNYYANIRNGKLKVTLNDQDKEVEVK